jgi:ribosomal protein L37AE/L43A
LKEQKEQKKSGKVREQKPIVEEPKEPFKCPKCGEYELRIIPDRGWCCSSCDYTFHKLLWVKEDFFRGLGAEGSI